MKFKTYFTNLSADGKKELAKSLGTSAPYLSQVAHGHRNAGAGILLRIEKATNGRIKPHDMRDDITMNHKKAG
jgi:DNA-binding transcriptional regulator YdaS (Cro superfamily)